MIIGITGYKGSGKDTIGKYLIDNYNYKRYAFADPLKEICQTLFSFNDEQLYGNLKEEQDQYWKNSPRYFFQKIGTDLFRNQIDQDFWIKVLERKIITNLDQKIVITDVRFQNEFDMIKNLGGIVIRINNNNKIIQDNHESEQNINNFNVDYEINNNKNLEELYQKIEIFILNNK